MKSLSLLIAATFLYSAQGAEFCPLQPTTTPACNTPDNRQCWGEYDIHTDYSTVFPETNIIREVKGHSFRDQELLLTQSIQYDIVASNIWIAPDGVEVLGMVFNGQFPGPVIEAMFIESKHGTRAKIFDRLTGVTL
jgi:hypothetical protein